ncbi:unnamed protein product [Linum tenue]|uniref:CASP-like protein n=1 Tax=Linum tenue TaxID=586396 RepID=A0AAV0NBP7_9ROSI|nr:unnamed protein product [Linum tenue]
MAIYDVKLGIINFEKGHKIIAYLLLSASTSAAFRVEDWESNWGSDEFSGMARASLILSFLAFVAFASSSILSGYTLFTSHSL